MPKVSRPGRTSKYPFDKWFEAAEKAEGVELSRGDDFECEARTMRHNLYRHSNVRELDINTVLLNSEDGTESIALSVNTKTDEETDEKTSKKTK
jgi:hypothetical protein